MPNIDLRQAIVTEARRQGVDPAIAVAVATKESGIMQWYPNGQLVTGDKGQAIGIFQIHQDSAPGYDLSDPMQNIAAGVSYLKQMFNRYGDWRYALAGYNWGPGKVDKYLAGLASLPSSVNSYISFVMSRAQVYNAGLQIKFKNDAAAGPAGSPSPDNGASASPSISAGGASKPALIIGAAAFGLAAWLALS